MSSCILSISALFLQWLFRKYGHLGWSVVLVVDDLLLVGDVLIVASSTTDLGNILAVISDSVCSTRSLNQAHAGQTGTCLVSCN